MADGFEATRGHHLPETISRARELAPTPEDIERRKQFLQFDETDVARLNAIRDLAREYSGPLIEEFYAHILSFDETREYFRDPVLLERVKRSQQAYFVGLTEGDYGPRYVEGRLRVGKIHERIDLPFKYYLGMFAFYLRAVAKRLEKEWPDDPRRVMDTFISVAKLIFFDTGLATDAYFIQREATIRAQQEAIRELSTPVLQIRQGLLLLPVVGLIDSSRARQLTDQLLLSIRDNRCKVVVMDITGVPAVDSRVASHLVQTVEAARLMGASTILSGISPEIARTLAVLGVDLSKMQTVTDLQAGIEEAERLLGYRITRDGTGS